MDERRARRGDRRPDGAHLQAAVRLLRAVLGGLGRLVRLPAGGPRARRRGRLRAVGRPRRGRRSLPLPLGRGDDPGYAGDLRRRQRRHGGDPGAAAARSAWLLVAAPAARRDLRSRPQQPRVGGPGNRGARLARAPLAAPRHPRRGPADLVDQRRGRGPPPGLPAPAVARPAGAARRGLPSPRARVAQRRSQAGDLRHAARARDRGDPGARAPALGLPAVGRGPPGRAARRRRAARGAWAAPSGPACRPASPTSG